MTEQRRTDDLEVTIDLAAAERAERVADAAAAGGAAPAPRSGRRGWVVAVAVLAVAALAAGAWSVVLATRGRGWQERAEVYELRNHRLEHDLEAMTAARADAERRLAEVEASLEERTRLLQLSEEDVAALEARLGDLANEKAQAEDERERVRDEAQILASAATLATAAGAELDTCVADLTGWLAATPAGDAPAPVWDAWAADGDVIGARCAAAQASFDELIASFDG